ncbi:PCMD domain-containing protein [Carboxylicivirga mesophila]|uniref:PCMD domain-containing protein n=1 Tax=Carboxylicivirga mesophila TaxID=1166478 RepID=A0ABS5K721_9BACT|nr:PCMD domain-containing protein [Carboxylicivirga mesophila]MBS2210761.1 PCMD domain-containing protein [Carboxylicivirga mesophila]
MRSLYLILFTLTLTCCVREDYFGLSPYGNIKHIVVSNQSGNAKISTDSLLVTIEIPGGVELSNITIQSFEISSFASSDKTVGDILNLYEEAQINVTSEDGTIYGWRIRAFVASTTPQLDNGNLNLWYKTASQYYEPGLDAKSTIWGTGNRGTQILNKLATIPNDLGNDNLAAKMITLDNGTLAGTFGAPISAGSLFTGVFNPDKIDPANPQAAIEFGTPFTGRPDKLRFTFSYNPGEENKDKKGNILDYGDACDIYALLEIRQGGKIQRLATAWFRSDEMHDDFSPLEIPFVYGDLDNSYPGFMMPVEHGFVSQDSATFVLPTHITFVASSSFDGANFAGAIGSELIIDDIEMVYE